jgi:hypothetical protein
MRPALEMRDGNARLALTAVPGSPIGFNVERSGSFQAAASLDNSLG